MSKQNWIIGSVYNEVNKVIPKVFDKNGPTFILVDGNDTKTNKAKARLIAAAPELLEIAKAYRNLLKTMAHTDGEVATYHHIVDVITKAEGGAE